MMTCTKRPWGTTANGEAVDCYTLDNGTITVEILTYGGVIHSLCVPDKNGDKTDVVLGFDDLATYEAQDKYIGALIGRHGNRIEDSTFTLDGKTYHLYNNDGRNNLHGGKIGFDRHVWDAEPTEDGLKLSLFSPDGEEGFPGNLTVCVTYSLTENNGLSIHYQASTDAPTVCNLTNHSYFNLAGQSSCNILSQQIQLNADRYTPGNDECLPNGTIAPVDGTPMDLRQPTVIGAHIEDDFEQLKFAGGYDHNWVINGTPGMMRCAAQAYCAETGIHMTVQTTSHGIQFYTGNFLAGCPAGKGGAPYDFRSGFCLETQYYPNALCHPNFPQPIITPEHGFDDTTVYEFSVD